MSLDEPTPKLPEAAEALLANWNVAEPDWESRAAALEAKLSDIAPGSTDPKLLEPALPREPDEGEIVAAARATAPAPAPNAPGQSLAALARAAVRRTSAEEEAANIAKETLAVAAARRAPSAELVERVQAASRAAAEAKPATEPALDDAPRASGVVSRTPPKRSPNLSILYGTGVAVLGLAAGLVLFIQSRRAPQPAPAPLSTPAATQAVAPPSVEAAPEAPAERLAEADRKHAPPPSIDSEPAPAQPEQAAPAKALAAPRPAVAPPAPSATAASGPAPEKIVLEEEAPAPSEPPAPSAPAAQPKPEPPMRPADGSGGPVAQKPSIGAVQAAIGSVMGAARSCVAGQSEPSRAQVVFGSDGAVQSVSVSGPAAGTPAGTCIETALKKARMQPFAVPVFSTSVTVRPP